jgi:hypothetical protein
VSQSRLTHLFCVSIFGLIPVFCPVSNLFLLCAFSQATACQSTIFPVTYLNRHVDRTDAACFRVPSDFETPCFQLFGFNYSVTSVIGVNFKYPVYFVCCLHRFTAIASVNRYFQCSEYCKLLKYSFPIFPRSFLRLFQSKLLVLGQLFFVLFVFNRRICFLVSRIFFTWKNVRCNPLLFAYLSVSVALPTTFRACTKYFRVIISKN